MIEDHQMHRSSNRNSASPLCSKERGGHNPNQPDPHRANGRQRRQTLSYSNGAATLEGDQQNSTGQKSRQRPGSPSCSNLPGIDPFGIDSPSDKECSENSLSTISPSFIRKFSRIYKWLRKMDVSPPCSIRAEAYNANEETSNRNNVIQWTPSPPQRRMSTLNIENQSTNSNDSSTRRSKKCLAILLTLVLLCAVISGVAIYKFKQKETIQTVTSKVKGLLKVSETFHYEMADSNSPKFQSFEERFCSNIESVLILNISLGRCKVNNLSNGSIIVNFTLVISDERSVNETQDLLICLFNSTQVGVMTIDSQATRFTLTPDGAEKSINKELKSSSCSSDFLPILPMGYTYPDYCGDYRMCIEGNSVLETCPQGQEFAYFLRGDTVICAPPSNDTYCGRKKFENKNTAQRFEWVAFSFCSSILIALALPHLIV